MDYCFFGIQISQKVFNVLYNISTYGLIIIGIIFISLGLSLFLSEMEEHNSEIDNYLKAKAYCYIIAGIFLLASGMVARILINNALTMIV